LTAISDLLATSITLTSMSRTGLEKPSLISESPGFAIAPSKGSLVAIFECASATSSVEQHANNPIAIALILIIRFNLEIDRSAEGDVSNKDGTIDIYFGPEAPVGKEKNWVKTDPAKGWTGIFRLYGPLEPFFDQSWKLNDLEPLE
jgi:hypothetical protein